MMRVLLLSLALVLGSWAGEQAAGAEVAIDRLRHTPKGVDPAKGEVVDFRFALPEPARVTLRIFDGRDWLVRRITSERELPSGAHELQWDGRDESGRLVPPEAYHYALEAVASDGQRIRYDLTDHTGNQRLRVTEVVWDREAGVVRYLLPDDARVIVKIGIANGGPLLVGLLDWVPRQSGWQEEAWDGFDASHTLNLADHPDLEVAVYASSLPNNAIFVLPRPDKSQLVDASAWPKEIRESNRRQRKRARISVVGKLELQQTAHVRLSLPPELPRTAEGVPVVSGVVPVRLDVSDEDRARVETERFETNFFLDWKYQFENETGFLPATWLWDTANVSPGLHILTGNFHGYEGKHGSATVQVVVERKTEAKRPSQSSESRISRYGTNP